MQLLAILFVTLFFCRGCLLLFWVPWLKPLQDYKK